MQLAVTAHECDVLGVYMCGLLPSLPPPCWRNMFNHQLYVPKAYTQACTQARKHAYAQLTHIHTHMQTHKRTQACMHTYTYARTYKRARKTTGVLVVWKSTYAYNRSRSYRTTKTQCVPTCLSSTCDALWCARRRERETLYSPFHSFHFCLTLGVYV
mmetsp:Transcript_11655/g.31329  ORF Transcript_11655/g.31329 Transcript_11655/m.31329 type:complete len:157 (+) Transcript_11655:760-1230(+)